MKSKSTLLGPSALFGHSLFSEEGQYRVQQVGRKALQAPQAQACSHIKWHLVQGEQHGTRQNLGHHPVPGTQGESLPSHLRRESHLLKGGTWLETQPRPLLLVTRAGVTVPGLGHEERRHCPWGSHSTAEVVVVKTCLFLTSRKGTVSAPCSHLPGKSPC